MQPSNQTLCTRQRKQKAARSQQQPVGSQNYARLSLLHADLALERAGLCVERKNKVDQTIIVILKGRIRQYD